MAMNKFFEQLSLGKLHNDQHYDSNHVGFADRKGQTLLDTPRYCAVGHVTQI